MQQDPQNTEKPTEEEIAEIFSKFRPQFAILERPKPTKVAAIRIYKNGTTQDVEAMFCQYMYLAELMGEPGVFYKLDASKMPYPVNEVKTFVPLHTIVQLVIDE